MFDENPLSKQNSLRWDDAFCGVTSWVILFAKVPQKGHDVLTCGTMYYCTMYTDPSPV